MFENINHKKLLLIGELANLNAETLNSLLLKQFEHVYLIKPNEEVVNHISLTIDQNAFSILKNITEIEKDIDGDLCLIGFPPLSNEIFKKFKDFKNNILVFFDSSIGGFRSLWLKHFKSVKIIEEPISDFLSSENNEVHFVEKINKTIPEFFTNRGNEIDAFRRFIVSHRLRCAKIIGLDGIGKKSFVNYLKTYHNLEDNCFEIHFNSSENTIFDLVNELGKHLSVRIIDKEISTIKKDFNPGCILRLFDKFDKIENAKIIFRNFHLIYNIDKNEFYDNQLTVFFHNLIVRNSYDGNKLYFTANTTFSFPYFQSEDICTSITLPPIHSRYIKIIMEREFLQKEKRILANQIMQLEDKVIDELVGGHPHIAKLFIKACDNASIDTIINDDDFRKRFEEEKVKYLFEIITFNSNHRALECLNYLSCINEPFRRKIISEIDNNDTAEVISYLRNRFLLNIEYYENGKESYEVPILIRKFIKQGIPKTTYKSINNFLGNIYWVSAIDFNTSTIEMLANYRASEFHFKEAENIEMLKKLILLFKEKYLQKAISLYHRHQFNEAYILFKELFNSNYIINDQHANFFLVCCSKIEANDTKLYAEKVHFEFPLSKFITNTIASYYFRHEDFDNALKYVTKSIDIRADDYVAIGLYYNILSKIGRENEAYEFYEKKLNTHLSPKIGDESRIQHVRYLMNYYQIVGFNKAVFDLTDDILFYLPEKCRQTFRDYLNKFIDEKFAHKLSAAFQIALNSKYPDTQIKSDYKKYIDRQKNIQVNKQNMEYLKKFFLEKVAPNIKIKVIEVAAKLKKSLQILNTVNSIDLYNPVSQLAFPIVLLNQYNFNLIETLMINPDKKLKIIFTSANPNKTGSLKLDREFRTIEEHIKASKERDKIELLSKWALRLPDLTKALLDNNPQILHFSGHGSYDGLAFENANGDIETINTEGLKRLFSMFKESLQCVILNACYSEEIAKIISNESFFVVGMNDSIADDAAIKFSTGFYQACGAGKDFETAFKLGLVFTANSIANKDTPTLWKDGIRIL